MRIGFIRILSSTPRFNGNHGLALRDCVAIPYSHRTSRQAFDLCKLNGQNISADRPSIAGNESSCFPDYSRDTPGLLYCASCILGTDDPSDTADQAPYTQSMRLSQEASFRRFVQLTMFSGSH